MINDHKRTTREVAEDVARAASRDFDRHSFDLAQLHLFKHVTVDRFHPLLIEAGMPVVAAHLKLLSRTLRPWVQTWCRGEVKGRSYESALRAHLQSARQLLLPVLDSRGSSAVQAWTRRCWPLVGFPGDYPWVSLLYGLVHFKKTYTKLPRALYRNQPLRKQIESLYLTFEEETAGFQRRVKTQLRNKAHSDWERFLVSRCHMTEELKRPERIIQAHEHLMFCKFWRSLNGALTPSEFETLKQWISQEAKTSFHTVEQLDLVNCECLALARRRRVSGPSWVVP